MWNQQLTLNCAGKLISLEKPIVMGVINLNEDSFYADSRVTRDSDLIERIGRMIEEGLTILDLGAMSSRPGAEEVSVETELKRLLPNLKRVRKAFPNLPISIDTYRSEVALAAADLGASIINDISGFRFDERLPAVCVKYQMPYILMHMKGLPANMQMNPHYEDVKLELLDYFIQKVAVLRKMGLLDIIIDPGFGFGKTLNHNYTLLKNLHVFRMLDLPILVGISRKSMINKVLNVLPKDALNGSTALHMACLLQGAKILRVHDVKEAFECIQIYNEIDRTN